MSLASSQQRCTAPAVMPVPITSADGGSSDSGNVCARRSLTSTRSASPSGGWLMCATSFMTDLAIPCAPGNAFTRASMRIERSPPGMGPLRSLPGQLLNVTLQPLTFGLLFNYAFNGAIILPEHGSRRLQAVGRTRVRIMVVTDQYEPMVGGVPTVTKE